MRAMADPQLVSLLADPKRVTELLAKTLPDDKVTVEDVAARLSLLRELDDPRLELESILRELEHTPRADIEAQVAAEALQQAAKGQHTLYAITARHHRIEPYAADWYGKDCQQVRVTLPATLAEAEPIWTHLGVVKASDHLLFSVADVVAAYAKAYGTTPTVGRVDLITGARHLDIDRFAPISIFLAYEQPTDTLPCFYYLESGSAQGNPAAIYTSPGMDVDIHTQADFSFTPFACAQNWYTGGLIMNGAEPATVVNSVAQLKDGQRSYLRLTAEYRVIEPGAVIWPIRAQIEASLRVFALAQGMDVELFKPVALQHLLGDCARRIYEWAVEPPRSGPADGYDGCPKT